MARWFRFYDDAINDPKILKLPEAMRWHWTAFLCIASKHEGVIPPLDDLAILLRVTPAKATEIIAVLVKAGLLDKLETGYAPHNWDGRQYKSDVSTGRVKRFRNSKRNVSGNDDETFQKRPQITDTETDNSEAKASGAVAPPDPSIAERELFDRGKQLLGKSAGGQIAKLKAAKGGNVALARAVIEAASTKENPAEYVAAAIRAGPRSGFAKPLTEFQRKQQETNDVRQMLRDSATAARGGGTADRVLSIDHGGGPASLRSGAGSGVLDLRAAPSGEGR